MEIVNANSLHERTEPLTWDELVTVIRTAHGIRCISPPQAPLELQQGCTGDSLALPYGLPRFLRTLEKEGKIQRHEPTFPRTANWTDELLGALSRFMQSTSDEELNENFRRLNNLLGVYNTHDRNEICSAFTDALLDYLRYFILLLYHNGTRVVAFLLIKSTLGVRDETYKGYGRIGKAGKGRIEPGRYWQKYVVVNTEEDDLIMSKEVGDNGLLELRTRQALAGLLSIYSGF